MSCNFSNIIEGVLKECNISQYKIIETGTTSCEMFFIKKALDLSRGKEVTHYTVTVYKDFVDNGKKYKGSSQVNIHPTMNREEIKSAILNAALACNFIKNEYYEINVKNIKKQYNCNSNFKEKEMCQWMSDLTKALYKGDTKEKGWINSSEIFLNNTYTRIITCNGVDEYYEGFDGMIEFITNWKEKEEVELYKSLKFSDYDEGLISNATEEMLYLSKQRAMADTTVTSGNYDVIFNGSSVKTLLSYYYEKAKAEAIYNGTSDLKIGQNIQGESVTGDKLSIMLEPELKGSTLSYPCDSDGVELKKTCLYENGILNNYIGDIRHSYYLGVEPTGNIMNYVVSAGSHNYNDMKNGKYVELTTFSDFQIDSITGDFGGEIRLGWYHDGSTIIPITGGSVSGNIKDFHNNMIFSKEVQQINNFKGPKALKMFKVSIAGK